MTNTEINLECEFLEYSYSFKCSCGNKLSVSDYESYFTCEKCGKNYESETEFKIKVKEVQK